MSRLKVLLSSPKLLLVALAAVLVAGAIAVGSGASFTSHSANAANTFSAGNLSQTNSVNGALLTISKMKPGDSSNGSVTIANNGDVSGAFTLSKANLTDTAGPNGGTLSSKLDLKVEDGTTVLYSGKVGAMGSISLGTFAPGASHTIKFTVTFPDGGVPATATTGDNAFRGSSMTVDYSWDAV
jgi:spore coat-associated protein N